MTLGRQIARAEPERGLDRQQNQAEYGPGLGPVPHQPGGPGGAEGYDEEGDQEDDEGAGLDPQRPGAAVHGEDAEKTVALEGLRSN